jgi:hypothetical protein
VRIPSGRRLAVVVALCLLVLAGVALLFQRAGEARGSALSRGPAGWLAARRYLEARGAKVDLLAEPAHRSSAPGVLVVTFPWQQGFSLESAEQLRGHVRRGGDLVLAYSGTRASAAETVVLIDLDFPLREVRKPVWTPLGWRRFTREEWDLQPAVGRGRAAPVRIWAPRWMPTVPKEARVLLAGPKGEPAVAVLERYGGRIWFLPVDALANSRLGGAGNADLLETLLRRLGDRWTFDEYHHGLAKSTAASTVAFRRILDLVLIHLVVLYMVGLFTLSRRFGPAWAEPPMVSGSVGSFLRGLGALHDRLGHHAEAARLLLSRARELDRDLVVPEDLARRANTADTAGPKDLVELAGAVARLRQGRPQNAARENA